MRYTFILTIVAVLTVACNAQPNPADTQILNKKDTMSYALGANIGKNMAQQKLPVNIDLVAAGIRDAFNGSSKLADADMQAALQSLQEEVSKAMEAEQGKAKVENLAKSNKFLEENKTKTGVMTTPSGLQYRVIKEGTGKKPNANNTVRVHYTGTLIDGTKFDSSVDRGQPAEFALNGVIAGWTEGLQLMPVGSKYVFYLPPNLAYGENGAGASIGPNQALIFEVELLEIVK